jgi:hypothetical protein
LRSDLTEKVIRQKKPGLAGLFFFQFNCPVAAQPSACHIFFVPVILRGAVCCTGSAVRSRVAQAALRRISEKARAFSPETPRGSYPEKQSRKTALR